MGFDATRYGAILEAVAQKEGTLARKIAIERNEEVLRRRIKRLEERKSRYQAKLKSASMTCMIPECGMTYTGRRRRGVCASCYAMLQQLTQKRTKGITWKVLEEKGICLPPERNALKPRTVALEKLLGVKIWKSGRIHEST